jgi:UDP-N-acetylglucosamine--N-acetylmuramyl-(pentapeptide) pyrophosphoryl-undecaprenol N-acetylglucosamine transferase
MHKDMKRALRVIISGGGTGGHIFPAVSIANAVKEQHPDAEILFVGAEGRMEMYRVPAAGYQIIGLPVAGFDRKNLLKNISVLFKLARASGRHAASSRSSSPMWPWEWAVMPADLH